MRERWKPVIGYEDCYKISDQGRCVRTSTYGANPKPRWKFLAKRPKRLGYVTYHLCKDGRRVDALAHRLVWEAFKGLIPDDVEVSPKNNIRSDARLSNLELMTRSENAAEAFQVHGRPAPDNPSPGSKNGSAKLTEADIPTIIRLYQSGRYRQKDIGQIYGVSQRMISLITRREKWLHVKI